MMRVGAYPRSRQFRSNSSSVVIFAIVVALLVVVPTGGLSATSGAPGESGHAGRFSYFGNGTVGLSNGSASSNGSSSTTLPPLAPSSPLPPFNLLGNWPTYGQNPQRTGDNANENTIAPSNASQLTQLWSYQTTAGVYGSPAVVNDTVFIGDYSGNETAIWASNGTARWSQPAHLAGSSGNYSWTGCFGSLPFAWNNSDRENAVRGITASATVWNNTVFVPADNNHLYAINVTTKAILPGWPVDLSNNSSDPYYRAFYPWGSPLVYNDFVYVGTASGCDSPLIQGQLLQINISSHPSVVKAFSVTPTAAGGGGIWSTPSIDAVAKTIWITTGNTGLTGPSNGYNWSQAIVGLNASNVCQPSGTSCTSKGYFHLNSSSSTDIDFGAGATVYRLSNGTAMVVATNKNGVAYAFYATTLSANGGSKPAWTLRTSNTPPDSGGWNIAPAAYDGGLLYFGGSNTTLRTKVGCPQGSVRAVYPNNGSIKWESCAPGDVRAGLTVADGLVVDAADWKNNAFGTLEVRSAATGTVLKNITVSQGINGEPVISDGRLFFGTGNWTLCGNTIYDPHCPVGHVYAYGLPVGGSNSTAVPYVITGPDLVVYPYGNATGGMPAYNYTWAWGDGQTAYGRYPGWHLYANGRFVLVLTVTDAAGQASQTAWEVYQNYYACGGSTLKFCYTGGVIPCITVGSCFLATVHPVAIVLAAAVVNWVGGLSWNWNFGDGSTHSTVPRPAHTYAQHGTYAITVSVTDQAQHQATKQYQVTV
jgi:outer membrane protein assembly factor BamB